MRIRVILLFLLIFPYSLPAQEADAISIHRHENEKYTPYIHSGREVFDSINGFIPLPGGQKQ